MPRSGPSTNSGVSQPSASMHVSAATVTDASACSTGRPVAGSMMCEYRRPSYSKNLCVPPPSRSPHSRAAPPPPFHASRHVGRSIATRHGVPSSRLPPARTSPPSSTMKSLDPRSPQQLGKSIDRVTRRNRRQINFQAVDRSSSTPAASLANFKLLVTDASSAAACNLLIRRRLEAACFALHLPARVSFAARNATIARAAQPSHPSRRPSSH